MRNFATAGIALLVAMTTATTAFAADGCGPAGFRYNPYGRCHFPGPGPAYYGPRSYYGYGYNAWHPHRSYGYWHGGYGWRY